MPQYIMYDDLSVVKSKFIEKNLPYYFVTDAHNNILFSNESETDIDAAAEMLVNDLKDIRKESQIIFNIKLAKAVPAKGGFKKTTDFDTLLTYKQKKPEYSDPMSGNGNYYNSVIMQKLDNIQMANDELRMKIEMLESEDETEEAPPPQNLIGAIMSHPNITDVIVNLITNISANLMTQKTAPRALAGVDTIEAILDRLISKGVTIDDLQKLSNMPNEKISMLLQILRSN